MVKERKRDSVMLIHKDDSRWLIEGNRREPDSIDITTEEDPEPSDEQQQQQPVAGQAAE